MSERVQHDEQCSSLHDRWRFRYDERCSSLHAEGLRKFGQYEIMISRKIATRIYNSHTSFQMLLSILNSS